MKIIIYKLIDPITLKIRYIGKTKDKLNIRLSKHISSAKREKNHRANWINHLTKRGLKPIIEFIEETDEFGWEIRERYWIKKHRSKKIKLTNSTDGGQSRDPLSASICAKKMWQNKTYRELHSGNNHHMKKLENKLKVTGSKNGMYGKTFSAEHRAKISQAGMGRKLSAYQKEKLLEGARKPKSLEHKLKLSKRKRKLSDEDISRIRILRKKGMKLRELKLIFKISESQLSIIINKKHCLYLIGQ